VYRKPSASPGIRVVPSRLRTYTENRPHGVPPLSASNRDRARRCNPVRRIVVPRWDNAARRTALFRIPIEAGGGAYIDVALVRHQKRNPSSPPPCTPRASRHRAPPALPSARALMGSTAIYSAVLRSPSPTQRRSPGPGGRHPCRGVVDCNRPAHRRALRTICACRSKSVRPGNGGGKLARWHQRKCWIRSPRVFSKFALGFAVNCLRGTARTPPSPGTSASSRSPPRVLQTRSYSDAFRFAADGWALPTSCCARHDLADTTAASLAAAR
jgi:hypothetical protein